MDNQNQTAARRLFQHQKSRILLGLTLLAGLLALTFAMAGAAAGSTSLPQAAITGEWTAELQTDRADRIQLNLSQQSVAGRSNIGNSDYTVADFQGLTREQMTGAKTEVKFRLVREAGTFEFEGYFREGRGAGVWTLVPSQSFIGEMRARGFDNLSEERLIASAMLDIHVKTVDDLRAAGFKSISMEDVIKATIFRITPEFIAEMKSIGFDSLGLEDLVKARIFKIDAAFAREVKEMGLGRETLESLVKMRIFKITPDFLREMRAAGLENLSIEDLVKLKIFKIDSDFIQRAKANGYTNPDVEELVRLRIHERVR